MDPSFIPVEVVPSKTPFGLDQLRRSYKTSLSAEDAIAAAPAVGTADEAFPFMFLMPISTPESAESATRIDLLYMGSFGAFASAGLLITGFNYLLFDYHAGDDFTNVGGTNVSGTTFTATGTTPTSWANGSVIVNVILPDQKHTDSDSVASATSSKGTNSFITLTSPLTVQFYAPNETLNWFTYLARGAKGTAADPTRGIEIITVTCGDNTAAFSSVGVAELVAQFFTEQIVDTFQSQEIVPGKYWQNTESKVKQLSPLIINLAPGFYPSPYSGGSGYQVGDSISITGTGSCTMTVVAVYTPSGQIGQANITSNSLSAISTTPIFASGGSGSGASYTVIQVT